MFQIFTRLIAVGALVTTVLGRCDLADAVGPVLHQDCVIAWGANPEPDIAGYRVHVGRVQGLWNQTTDVGNVTQAQCSRIGATMNGQWIVAVTAYDRGGNESVYSTVLPFELAALSPPVPVGQIAEPAAAQLSVREPGIQLAWADTNLPPVSHRIEIASSLIPNWTTVTVLPPGVTRFSYFHPVDVEWACYRVRAESGAVVSPWAQAGGPNDRQFCLSPTRAPTIDRPIPFPAFVFEPTLVQLAVMRPGFQMTWGNADGPLVWNHTPVRHRIEVMTSINPSWTTLTVLNTGELRFAFLRPIDAAWVCFRIRNEIDRFVSLWAVAGSPSDRQFCYSPLS